MEQEPLKRILVPVEKIGKAVLNILEDIGGLRVATSPGLIKKSDELDSVLKNKDL